MRVGRKIETLANVAIICVAILLGVVLVKRFLLPGGQPPNLAAQPPAKDLRVPPGSKVALPNIDWTKNHRTLILAISTQCHFCTDSAAFYQNLMVQRGDKPVRVIAVLPQPDSEAKTYLEKLGVKVDELRQLPLDSLGVSATPTLIMVDESGNVIDSWVGKLPSDKEKEVISRMS